MVTIEPPFITELRSHLAEPLPGVMAQIKMALRPPYIPPLARNEGDAMPSAVLILLFEENEEWSFFLMERSHTVEYHRGQISLPGGAQEQGESLEETALRETSEEIGIVPASVKILGAMTPLFIPVSGFRVHPFVGWSETTPEATIDEIEVAALHKIHVDALLDDSVVKSEQKEIREFDVDVPYFHFEQLKVWGATAAILSECKDLFSKCYFVEKEL